MRKKIISAQQLKYHTNHNFQNPVQSQSIKCSKRPWSWIKSSQKYFLLPLSILHGYIWRKNYADFFYEILINLFMWNLHIYQLCDRKTNVSALNLKIMKSKKKQQQEIIIKQCCTCLKKIIFLGSSASIITMADGNLNYLICNALIVCEIIKNHETPKKIFEKVIESSIA